ncbi:MAG TPA: hypothetical protein VFI49_12830 [Rudaea sp.]|nr:hypothetical protein [Rudaea sp.]
MNIAKSGGGDLGRRAARALEREKVRQCSNRGQAKQGKMPLSSKSRFRRNWQKMRTISQLFAICACPGAGLRGGGESGMLLCRKIC